jgi:hypothetical protein
LYAPDFPLQFCLFLLFCFFLVVVTMEVRLFVRQLHKTLMRGIAGESMIC